MFVRVLSRRRMQGVLLLAAVLLLTAGLLLLPQAAAAGVSRGLSLCACLLIPSLFPFLVLSGFLTRSGLYVAIGRRLQKPTMALFGLPGCCAPGILLALIGGYPTGAVAVAELREQGRITEAQAGRMLRFCVCAGPAFLVSAVGVGMLGSAAYGWVLYLAHITAALLLGIGERLLCGPLPDGEAKPAEPPAPGPAAALAESVRAGCRSMLQLCGFVVAFCTLLSLLDALGLPAAVEHLLSLPFAPRGGASPLRGLVSGLLEISTGCLEMVGSGAPDALLLGFIVGFGSLSVHCQLCAALHGQCRLTAGFWAARLLHGMLGGLLARLLLHWIPAPLQVLAAANGSPVQLFSVSAAVSAALLLMCALFLLGTAKKDCNLPEKQI